MTKEQKLETILKKISTPEEYREYSISSMSKDIDKKEKSIQGIISEIDERFEISSNSLGELRDELNEYLVNFESDIEKKIVSSSGEILSVKNLLSDSISSLNLSLRKVFTHDLSIRKQEINSIIKKIQKDIEELFWWRSLNGSNNVQAVLNIKSNGTTIANNVTGLNFTNATITTNPDGTVNITTSGSGGLWYQDEIIAQNTTGTSFNLLHIPTSVVFLYKNGQYLTSGSGQDYTRILAAILLSVSLTINDILTATYS